MDSLIPTKIPEDFFFCVKTGNLILKFIWKCKNKQTTKTKQNPKIGKTKKKRTLSDFPDVLQSLSVHNGEILV